MQLDNDIYGRNVDFETDKVTDVYTVTDQDQNVVLIAKWPAGKDQTEAYQTINALAPLDWVPPQPDMAANQGPTPVDNVALADEGQIIKSVPPFTSLIYRVGNELYYNDESGNSIQITNKGTVNGAISPIQIIPIPDPNPISNIDPIKGG